ncbi:MAG TPA: LarC family nickel insertion protein [Sulfitobacter sp.]|uniref:LarC family nickel insertion protein n=1 Tax=Sulfitobacter dubius TaxID=218673 RepID=UPI000C4ADFF7|nr:hypothetical protein [Sulfitobacter sp.]HBB85612.1 LarC family nickel insertion protein [Sulfitobacter sp.]
MCDETSTPDGGTNDAPSVDFIHLDAAGGIAGDMFVAALLDCFPDLVDRVMADLKAVQPDNGSVVRLHEAMVTGMRALRFGTSQAGEPGDEASQGYSHGHSHNHDHSHGSSYAALRLLIAEARLSYGTKEQSLAILSILAKAEAKLHGVLIEDVHFHEVGDWDSLLDVVAAGSLIAALPGVVWTVSPLPLGAGLVKTEHGLLPVPAPATVEILNGFIWRDDGVGGERVTPTGAAILRHLCHPELRKYRPEGTLVSIGTGAGTKEFETLPNILRATAFAKPVEIGTEEIIVLAFDVDDMTGEEIATAGDLLRNLPGVLELTFCALTGKKSRPAVRFELLVRPPDLKEVCEACFLQTSTIGLRWVTQQRKVLERSQSRGNGVRMKLVERPGNIKTVKVEQDDLAPLTTLRERRAKQREIDSLHGGADGS